MCVRFLLRFLTLATGLSGCAPGCAAPALAPGLALAVQNSGLPLKSFGFYAEPVDGRGGAALAALNAEQPFLLASTAKVVTTLAALHLLGADHLWHSQAFASAPIVNGRLVGDLVIVGSEAGLTPAELRRWFKAMRSHGLAQVSGRIVLQNVSLLHGVDPLQAAASAEEASPGATPEAREYLRGALAVVVQATAGGKAAVSLQPSPLGVTVINDVLMGGGCSAWANWRSPEETGGGPPQLWVRGRWDTSCGKQQIAYVRPPASVRLAPAATAASAAVPRVSAATLVASLWAEAGGKLRGRVIESQRPVPRRAARAAAGNADDSGPPERWASEFSTPLPELIREINKTSNNLAARKLMLSLGDALAASPGAMLRSAQDRVHTWLRSEGLAEGDLHIDIGSGQSRAERGTPRAMVQLLHKAWGGSGSQAFIDSLPIAGVDGTLAHRLRSGSATGQAYLKTGTLSDTRALAGYVRARSGKVYAVAAIANHANAARATPALDAFIEWVARNG